MSSVRGRYDDAYSFHATDLEVSQSVIQDALNKLPDWSLECNSESEENKGDDAVISSDVKDTWT